VHQQNDRTNNFRYQLNFTGNALVLKQIIVSVKYKTRLTKRCHELSRELPLVVELSTMQ